LIDGFEADSGESRYPNESISPDNIMVKLKANAEQNATPIYGSHSVPTKRCVLPSRGKHFQNTTRVRAITITPKRNVST
jgi:hypothetical protein